MPIAALALLIAFSGGSVAAALPAMFQSARDGGCAEWRTCRELALAAAERGEYGTFHDLAWRAVQTGPPKDPSLMYLLARAQALSGRPHDALIMLQRLAEMGMASDASTNEDFNRVRELRDWPAVEARIAAAGGAIPRHQRRPLPRADAGCRRPRANAGCCRCSRANAGGCRCPAPPPAALPRRRRAAPTPAAAARASAIGAACQRRSHAIAIRRARAPPSSRVRPRPRPCVSRPSSLRSAGLPMTRPRAGSSWATGLDAG